MTTKKVFRSCVFLLAVAVSLFAVPREGKSEDGRSLVHGILLNAQALRRYDVLLRHETLHDIAPDEFKRIVAYTRMRVDWDNDRFVGLAKAERVHQTPDGKRKRQVVASGLHWNGTKTRFTNPVGTAIESSDSFRTLASTHGLLPNLRFVGVREFPFGFYPKDSIFSFESMLARILTSKSEYVAEHVREKTIRLSVTSKTKDSSRVLGRSLVWRLSKETLMPERYEESLRWRKDNSTHTSRTRWETYKWKEFDGLYVPIEIVGDQRAKNEGSGFVIETSVHLHWFAVNEPIEESHFSVEPLESLEKFQQALDPSIAGATSLQEL